ncbi:NUDIX domain-containing protein [Streptosporangium sandarakinum]
MAADAIVTATDDDGSRRLLMVERSDGHGWAVPGGYVEPGQDPAHAAVRELEEETGLTLGGVSWRVLPARYVPDPRASDEAWMVTVPSTVHLDPLPHGGLPAVAGAERAAWVRVDTYTDLVAHLAAVYRGRVFAAHRAMLTELPG